jgi:hypothetical protein
MLFGKSSELVDEIKKPYFIIGKLSTFETSHIKYLKRFVTSKAFDSDYYSK